MRLSILMPYLLVFVSTVQAGDTTSDPVLSLDDYVLEDARTYTSEPGTLFETSSSIRVTEMGWVHGMLNLHYVYIGRVDTLVADCVSYQGHGIQYVALVRFEVIEPFWGIFDTHHIGEVHLHNDGDCIEYGSAYPYELQRGDKYLVCGRIKNGHHIILDTEMFKLANGQLLDPEGNPPPVDDLMQMVRTFQSKHDLATTLKAADLIVTVRSVSTTEESGYNSTQAEVELVHAGQIPDRFIRIHQEHCTKTDKPDDYRLAPVFEADTRYLLALQEGPGNEYSCVNGFLGAWRISGSMIRTLLDMPAGGYADAVSIARTLPQPH